MSAVLVTKFQRRQAAIRLRRIGYHHVRDDDPLEQLAQEIAKAKSLPFPATKPERSLLVRSFSNECVRVPGEIDAPEFVPLVVSEAMQRALARAHELYAIPSLADRLEGK